MKNKIFDQNQYDKRACTMLSMCMLFAILTNFFGAIFTRILGDSKVATYIIYFLAFIFIYYQIIKIRTPFQKFSRLIIVFIFPILIFLTNYLIFPSSREYFVANMIPLTLEILIWIPVGFFAMYVKNWNWFFKTSKYSPCVIAVMGVLGVGLLNFPNIYTYMEISNALLPGFLIGWYLFYKNNSLLNLASTLVIFVLQLLYGGRMSMLSCVVFVVMLFVVDLIWRKRTQQKNAVSIIIFLAATSLFFVYILSGNNALATALRDSRTIQTILSGNFVSSSSRDTIYEYGRNIIMNQGIKINGLFGDRIMLLQYMPGGSLTTGYIHNVFYEFIIDFGLLLGPVLLAFIFVPFCVSLIRTKDVVNKYVLIFFFCLIVLRLLVSGSWLIEGQFFVFIFVSYNGFTKKGTVLAKTEKIHTMCQKPLHNC